MFVKMVTLPALGKVFTIISRDTPLWERGLCLCLPVRPITKSRGHARNLNVTLTNKVEKGGMSEKLTAGIHAPATQPASSKHHHNGVVRAAKGDSSESLKKAVHNHKEKGDETKRRTNRFEDSSKAASNTQSAAKDHRPGHKSPGSKKTADGGKPQANTPPKAVQKHPGTSAEPHSNPNKPAKTAAEKRDTSQDAQSAKTEKPHGAKKTTPRKSASVSAPHTTKKTETKSGEKKSAATSASVAMARSIAAKKRAKIWENKKLSYNPEVISQTGITK